MSFRLPLTFQLYHGIFVPFPCDVFFLKSGFPWTLITPMKLGVINPDMIYSWLEFFGTGHSASQFDLFTETRHANAFLAEHIEINGSLFIKKNIPFHLPIESFSFVGLLFNVHLFPPKTCNIMQHKFHFQAGRGLLGLLGL